METTGIKSTGNLTYGYGENQLSKFPKLENEKIGSAELGVIYEKSNGVEDYGLYTSAGVSINKLSNNYQIQTALFSLGFYSGPTDGNLKSDISKKAIKNFQRVYGLDINGRVGKNTKAKLNSAYDMKCKIMNSSAPGDIDKAIKEYTFDYIQKDTFAKTWTFLRVGMGLTKKQAAGVCGNIINESAFSSDNVQDSSMPGVHNRNYKYSTKDWIGYGLLQWTYPSRKQGLKDMAKKMKLSVSDINAQLGYFRKEMKEDSEFKNHWKNICKAETYKEASDIFLRGIEKPEVKNYSDRRKHAKIIYDRMRKF